MITEASSRWALRELPAQGDSAAVSAESETCRFISL